MAPAPVLLPRPRSYRAAPDGHRVPDREPVEVVDGALAPQGYRLEISDDTVRLAGADQAGLRHAHATLHQLRHGANAPNGARDGALPACRIEDWPDFAVRGVMLDVSRTACRSCAP